MSEKMRSLSAIEIANGFYDLIISADAMPYPGDARDSRSISIDDIEKCAIKLYKEDGSTILFSMDDSEEGSNDEALNEIEGTHCFKEIERGYIMPDGSYVKGDTVDSAVLPGEHFWGFYSDYVDEGGFKLVYREGSDVPPAHITRCFDSSRFEEVWIPSQEGPDPVDQLERYRLDLERLWYYMQLGGDSQEYRMRFIEGAIPLIRMELPGGVGRAIFFDDKMKTSYYVNMEKSMVKIIKGE